jgi:addiction module RelE/StbE family toxin
VVTKKVEFSKRFIKSLERAPRKIQVAFRIRLEVFLSDPFNPILNNHSLKGKYSGYKSINVSGDWRAIFRDLQDKKAVYFIVLGTHNRLYK